MDQKRLTDFEFIPLFKGFCEEYKIDFDLRLCNYYKGIILRCGTEIYDLECLDQNAPPIFPQYQSQDYIRSQMVQHFCLNITLGDRLKEVERDILTVHRQILEVKQRINENPMYVRCLYNAYRQSKD